MAIRYKGERWEDEEDEEDEGELEDPPGEDADPTERISWLARHHHQVDGGPQKLDELLEAHIGELLSSLEDAEPVSLPDEKRWPYRVHEIRKATWKRWLDHVDSALLDSTYSLEDYGLAIQLTLSFRTGPQLTLMGSDPYSQRTTPVQTEGARALTARIRERLDLSMETLDAAMRVLGGQLDRDLPRLACIRLEAPAGLPGRPILSTGAVEIQLDAHRAKILAAWRDIDPLEPMDEELWPARMRELPPRAWSFWLRELDGALVEFAEVLKAYGADLSVTLRSDGSYTLALFAREDRDETPLRSPAAQGLAAAVLSQLEVPQGALQAAIEGLGGYPASACRRLLRVHAEV